MKTLLAASEIYPLAKTGGLADVCGALPAALQGLGTEVRVMLPAYECALDRVGATRAVADLGEILGAAPARVLAGELPGSDVQVWLLDCPALFRRPGTLYQDPQGADWPDNARRFAALSHAVARVAVGGLAGWKPDVLHCHDWHTGLVPWLVSRGAAPRPVTVFTIHNAAFQGNFPLGMGAQLGLPAEALGIDGMEFYGQISFLKAGIRYADRLTTVSPSYAKELCTAEFGCGLAGLIASRAGDFVGILNGIDTGLWNPATDGYIAERYSRDAPGGKAACKSALAREAGLAADAGSPLVAFASRLTTQKMADVALERLPALLQRYPRMQFALLASGQRELEAGFTSLAERYPGRVGVRIGHSEPEEHRLHAGADILLHGSRFEPCGLAQLYAMRYGALPVVRRVGGLADTVVDGDTGFVFDEASGDALEDALGLCLGLYREQPDEWQRMRVRAMQNDFGWDRPAQEYRALYDDAVEGQAADA